MHSQQAWDAHTGVAAAHERERAETSARRFWVTFIVGFLGLQVLGGITAIYLAVSDPTVAIIPNYYDSAVNWDVTRRARELTQDLGWRIETATGPVQAEAERRGIEVRIWSRSGKPVTGITVAAKVYHHARGADIYQLQFKEIEPGVYGGSTSLTKSGMWQVDLRMEGDHGIAAESRQILVK